MDRIWQWAWDRHGARYAWAAYVLTIPVMLLLSMTHQTVGALASRPPDLIDRGPQSVKGKSASVQVFGLDPLTHMFC